MAPSAAAAHVIDAVERRVAAAVAVAGAGAALAVLLGRLLLLRETHAGQAVGLGLAVAAALAASLLLAGPVAFAAREPARRAAFAAVGRAVSGGAAGAILGRAACGDDAAALLGGAVAGLSDAVARGRICVGGRGDRRASSDVILASLVAALRSACGAALLACVYDNETSYVATWLRSAGGAFATHVLLDVARRWLVYALNQPLNARAVAARAPDRRFSKKAPWRVDLAVAAAELGDPISAKRSAAKRAAPRTGYVTRSASDPFAAASSSSPPWRARADARQDALKTAVTRAFAKEAAIDVSTAWLAPPTALDIASGGLVLGDATVVASHRLAKWLALQALADGLMEDADDVMRDRALDVALLVLDGLTVRVELNANKAPQKDVLGSVRADTLACAVRTGRSYGVKAAWPSTLPLRLLDVLDPQPQPRGAVLMISAAECAACAAAARITATCPAFRKDGADRAAACLASLAAAARALGGVPASPDKDALALDVAAAMDALCGAFRAELPRFAFAPQYAATLQRHADAAAYN